MPILHLPPPRPARHRRARQPLLRLLRKCPWDSTGRYLLSWPWPSWTARRTPDDVATIGLVDTARATHGAPWPRRAPGTGSRARICSGCGSAPERLSSSTPVRRRGPLARWSWTCGPAPSALLPRPIYAVSADGAQAVSSTSPASPARGPATATTASPTPAASAAPDDDGVWRMDLATGERRLVLSIAPGRRACGRSPDMEGVEHWFNHAQFNTDGSRFAFLHRWRRPERPGWRTRLFTAQPGRLGPDLLARRAGQPLRLARPRPHPGLVHPQRRGPTGSLPDQLGPASKSSAGTSSPATATAPTPPTGAGS